MIRLFTDTSANLPMKLIQQYKLGIIPFTYSVNGVDVNIDATQEEFNGKAFYDSMREGAIVKTSMINSTILADYLRAPLAEGDDVLYIGMSGGISGTASAAALAAQELQEEFPEQKIVAIDTYAASLGEGLQVLQAARMIEANADFDTIVETIREQRNTMCQYFTVDDLEYLQRGGRISRVASVVGSVLKIKPLLTGDPEGHIILCGKARGRKHSLMALADSYDQLVKDRAAEIGIAHADDLEDAEFLLNELRGRGFIGTCQLVCYEPVTGSHVGPGTVALFFQGIHK
jgi:DegV family protein with EDD domain